MLTDSKIFRGKDARMSELISQAEFGRRFNVSEATVSRAISRGRIQKTASGEIDWETQSIAWEANRAVEKDHLSRRTTEGKGTREKYQEALLLSKFYESKIRELKYKELEGELISKESLMKHLFPKLTLIKNHMMALPARHAHTLAALVIRHIEKKSKNVKYIAGVLKKIDEQQLAREVAELFDSDMRSFLKEVAGAQALQ